MVSEQFLFAAGGASWGSIIAGGVSALALSVVMAILGVALGFTVVEPKSDEPASGLGIAFGVWSFVSVVVSMAGGGFIAGMLAGQLGLAHGFLVWALVILAAVFVSGIAVSTAVRSLGAAVKSMGSGAASLAGTMGKGAADAAAHAVTELRDNVSLHVDFDKLNDTVESTLRDTGVETLQPEYLHQQMREARSELRQALHQLALHPSDAETIMSGFIESQKSRLEGLTGGAHKETAVTALMNARNIPREEAQTLVDNALKAYDQALAKTRESLAEAREQIKDTKVHLREMADHAREKADRLATQAAKTALAAGVALIVAALISMGAAWCGTHVTGNCVTERSVVIR